MTIATGLPPPEAPGAEIEIRIGPSTKPMPGSMRFLGRALRTLWSNRKARIGLVILCLFALVAAFAPLIAPHSPTATSFTHRAGFIDN